MPNVWIINLKDNHTNTGKYNTTEQKTDWCFEKTCIAIGWIINDTIPDWSILRVKTEGQFNSRDCKIALRHFDAMKPGDLVWVRDYNGIYWIFEIKSKKPKQSDGAEKAFDIGSYRECTKAKKIGDRHVLSSNGINYKRLISRSTMRPVNADDLRDTTFELWKNLK